MFGFWYVLFTLCQYSAMLVFMAAGNTPVVAAILQFILIESVLTLFLFGSRLAYLLAYDIPSRNVWALVTWSVVHGLLCMTLFLSELDFVLKPIGLLVSGLIVVTTSVVVLSCSVYVMRDHDMAWADHICGACALMWVVLQTIRIMQEEMGYDPPLGINVPYFLMAIARMFLRRYRWRNTIQHQYCNNRPKYMPLKIYAELTIWAFWVVLWLFHLCGVFHANAFMHITCLINFLVVGSILHMRFMIILLTLPLTIPAVGAVALVLWPLYGRRTMTYKLIKIYRVVCCDKGTSIINPPVEMQEDEREFMDVTLDSDDEL